MGSFVAIDFLSWCGKYRIVTQICSQNSALSQAKTKSKHCMLKLQRSLKFAFSLECEGRLLCTDLSPTSHVCVLLSNVHPICTEAGSTSLRFTDY